MSIFSKAKNAYRLQRDAKRIKKELKNIHIEAEEEGILKVTVSAEQEVVSVTFSDEAMESLKMGTLSKSALDELLKKILNRALKKAQEVASQKMKHLWTEMGELR